MKYPEGAEVRIGDRVELWEGNAGVVVCSIDTNEYSAFILSMPGSNLVRVCSSCPKRPGLIHYKEPERTMRLLSRQS
jgi:hypothetical protein